ncbi:MAG: hypothetical protein LBN27_12095 [Prevotellaceae bacterium]|jgi:UDP-N-acetylglucosamine transferase subunit ALG13|nr:hypothetical protein [Prevotellaceae bacterium]
MEKFIEITDRDGNKNLIHCNRIDIIAQYGNYTQIYVNNIEILSIESYEEIKKKIE